MLGEIDKLSSSQVYSQYKCCSSYMNKWADISVMLRLTTPLAEGTTVTLAKPAANGAAPAAEGA